jgi:hypothetical protein
MVADSVLARNKGAARAAGPRPPSPREGAFATSVCKNTVRRDFAIKL